MSADDVASREAEPVVADHLAQSGAEQLARRIHGYWTGLGHAVRVWTEPTGSGSWGVRSNLRGGLPPAA